MAVPLGGFKALMARPLKKKKLFCSFPSEKYTSLSYDFLLFTVPHNGIT